MEKTYNYYAVNTKCIFRRKEASQDCLEVEVFETGYLDILNVPKYIIVSEEQNAELPGEFYDMFSKTRIAKQEDDNFNTGQIYLKETVFNGERLKPYFQIDHTQIKDMFVEWSKENNIKYLKLWMNFVERAKKVVELREEVLTVKTGSFKN
jgi:hypothetical protein